MVFQPEQSWRLVGEIAQTNPTIAAAGYARTRHRKSRCRHFTAVLKSFMDGRGSNKEAEHCGNLHHPIKLTRRGNVEGRVPIPRSQRSSSLRDRQTTVQSNETPNRIAPE